MEHIQLKKVGLKVTLPRVKVLKVLETSESRHLSAEDVYKSLLETGEEVGLATVYRVLTQFEQAGIVARHHFEGGHSIFELDRGDHHDHMVCLKCGAVEEFLDPVIEDRQHQIAKKANFKLEEHSMYLYGVCENCRGG